VLLYFSLLGDAWLSIVALSLLIVVNPSMEALAPPVYSLKYFACFSESKDLPPLAADLLAISQ
jgi:hypothetical protein